jgi:5-methylcytosine-specific restriction endonuclease McrA
VVTNPKGKSSQSRVLAFLLQNIGRVVTADEIREAARASEWARRLRQLRNEEGWQILSHRDRSDLKPGEYLLLTTERLEASKRGMTKGIAAAVFARDGMTCQMCGNAAGDPDPFNPKRKVRLTVGHILEKEKGGSDELSNLRAECTNCNEGLQNVTPPRPSQLQLLTYIRKATREDQLAALNWLEAKFKRQDE